MIINQVSALLKPGLTRTVAIVFFVLLSANSSAKDLSPWIKIDDFESGALSADWILKDTQNDTNPHIEKPQITQVRHKSSNHYLIKKAAADGITGNRKALTFKRLPEPVAPGAVYTIYLRVNVEYFPNNHVFGLSDMSPEEIALHDYNAFEPSIRVTDKAESDGSRNDGTLMVRKGDTYNRVSNPEQQRIAKPLQENRWYELWMVVNNAPLDLGGQRYDVYMRGGDEFPRQQQVFSEADFRMKRERPLIYFLANCNTGPVNHPYGNGGLRYDDLYMAKGTILTTPGSH